MEPQITLVGNLIADPKRIATASGSAVTRFRVICKGRRLNKTTGEWEDNNVLFLNVSCWRSLADNAWRTLHKGDTVVVQGKLLMSEYVDSKGENRQSYEVDASAIGPDLSRYVAQLSRPSRDLPEDAGEPAAETAGTEQHNPWGEPERQVADPAA